VRIPVIRDMWGVWYWYDFVENVVGIEIVMKCASVIKNICGGLQVVPILNIYSVL
jgi:hypothetical protein